MPTVVVIGAGISGLACARTVADLAPSAEIRVLEAGARAGGLVGSHHERGFTCEIGPTGFLNVHPSTLALALRVGLEAELVTGREIVRRRYVLHRGGLRRFPDSPGTFLSSDLLGWRGKLRMLAEPLVPRVRAIGAGSDDETVGHFARRRLGREAAELIVGPVVAGIYAGDPERLAVRSAMPQLAACEANGRSLLRGFLEARREPDAGDSVGPAAIGRRRLVSLRGGLGRLTEALARSLDGAIAYDSPVLGVIREGNEWIVEVGGGSPRLVRADAVACAVPAAQAAAILHALPSEVRRAVGAIPSVPLASVALGFREADVPHALDAFGYLAAAADAGSVLGVYFSTSMFPGRSPEGYVLLQAILGGARDPDACERSDDESIDATCRQLRVALGVTSAPVFARVFRHRLGLPQYEVGHGRVVRALEDSCARLPGLHVLGNAFRGVGINACTADAERVAQAIASRVRAGTTSAAGTMTTAM